MKWTPESITLVRELWGTISTAEIGDRIGANKNEVIGKAHRLGLPTLQKGPRVRLTTHCSRGHEFTPENTKIWCGTRRCMICRKASGYKPRPRKSKIMETSNADNV